MSSPGRLSRLRLFLGRLSVHRLFPGRLLLQRFSLNRRSSGLLSPHRLSLHRLPPGPKLLALMIAGSTLVLVSDWRWLVLLCVAMVTLYGLAGIGWRVAWAQLRSPAAFLAVLLAVQLLLGDVEAGVVMVSRFAALILIASLVTLTTRTSDMVATLEWALRPLVRIGIDPARVSLAISLALRFIPVLGERVAQIREAQRARGLDRNLLAIAVPLLVHCLRMADAVAEAIEARSGEPSGPPARAVAAPVGSHAIRSRGGEHQ